MSCDDAPEEFRLRRKAKGTRPYYFSNPDVDRLLSMIMALTGELAITRDRLDTLERVANSKDLFSSEDIETYNLDEGALAERNERHRTLLREVNRIISSEIEDLKEHDEEDYGVVMGLVEDDA